MQPLYKLLDKIKDKVKIILISWSVAHICGPKNISFGPDDVILLCLVKNGEPWIEEFLNYHLKLGVKHFVFLDNMSSDRTIEIAERHDNVTILQTSFPFAAGNDDRMRDYLLKRFGRNRWTLTCDIDEFFDYPFSDRITLKDLVEYLNRNNYTALVTQLCDMYPERISRFETKKFDRKKHKFFDDNIDRLPYCFKPYTGKKVCTDISIYEGGIRKKLFKTAPYLTKHALLYYSKGTERSRSIHFLQSGRIADFSAVLFHYKFISNFYEIVKEAVRFEQHTLKSKYYKEYFEVIKDRKALEFKHKNSMVLEDVDDLIKTGFLTVSKKFMNYVDNINNFDKKKDHSVRFSSEDMIARIKRVKERFSFISSLDARPRGATDDIAIVACFFNPCRYSTRLKNYREFRQSILKTRAKFLTVELVFGKNEFELIEFSEAICLRTDEKNVLWQKERLLNIGIQKLVKEGYKKIVWLDADMIFDDERWLEDLSKKLDRYPVCQAFSDIIWFGDSKDDRRISVGSVKNYYKTHQIHSPGNFHGGGWGINSKILKEISLFDYSIVGGGDSYFYFACFAGLENWEDEIKKIYPFRKIWPKTMIESYFEWAFKFGKLINGEIGYNDHSVSSLFHGQRTNKKHEARHDILKEYNFDPKKDIKLDKNQIWEWASDKDKMHQEIKDYFFSRKEDG